MVANTCDTFEPGRKSICQKYRDDSAQTRGVIRLKLVYISDLEGPISGMDHALEVARRCIRDGGIIFPILSRYVADRLEDGRPVSFLASLVKMDCSRNSTGRTGRYTLSPQATLSTRCQ
jgi:hypothetical protein